ncbi:MAG: amidohydrolase family protein [Myxococcota bacterium]
MVVGVSLLLPVLGYRAILDAVSGAWEHERQPISEALGADTLEFLHGCYRGLDPERLIDIHVHVAGIGTGGTGCEVNPRMRSWVSPIERLQFDAYMSAAGVEDLEQADQQFVEVLLRFARHPMPRSRMGLMAFDRAYHADGSLDSEGTTFYVPNEYVWGLCEENPDVFFPILSIHPLRPDAISDLAHWAGRGVRHMKWLPAAQKMRPDDPAVLPFLEALAAHDFTLIVHVGREEAVDADEHQSWGNPLRLRPALDAGVRVVMAHFGSMGEDEDLDEAGHPLVPSHELCLRLFEEERYEGRLFADISAILFVTRLGEPLEVLLSRPDLHSRLVNGSDYPLPASNIVVRLSPMVKRGFLTESEADHLRAIYAWNPLVFDFALKRSVRHPETGVRFAPEVFEARAVIGPR